MTCDCEDRSAIRELVALYATCLDSRDWSGLDAVLAEDVTGDYGGYVLEGRDKLVRMMTRLLGGCGPSQHLLGQHIAQIAGDTATCATEVRVIHVGVGDRASLTPYESIGTYHDQLRRTPLGWRIQHRRFQVRIETGDRDVLALA